MLLATIVRAFVDIPPGWASIIAAFLGVLTTGMAAVVGLIWRQMFQLRKIRTDAAKIRTDAAVTRDHVENDHAKDPSKTTNLRDDLDTRFGHIDRQLRKVNSHLSSIDEQVATLSANDAAHDEQLRAGSVRFDKIEHTIDPKELPDV